MTYLFQAELAVTFALLGLIWIVQWVHYPSFHFVESNRFQDFHRMHTRQISWIVLPLMCTELGLSAYRCWQAAAAWPVLIPFLLVVMLWASTFCWQVPLHGRLAAGKNTQVIRTLVHSNWLRTALWTLRAGWLLYGALAGAWY